MSRPTVQYAVRMPDEVDAGQRAGFGTSGHLGFGRVLTGVMR
ncbi:MAG TPA: hypothetical protein VD833_01365 [Vicinamibacterales bacterium]|nr:hypothetical protein [Vicinamibacterales bacterium]